MGAGAGTGQRPAPAAARGVGLPDTDRMVQRMIEERQLQMVHAREGEGWGS